MSPSTLCVRYTVVTFLLSRRPDTARYNLEWLPLDPDTATFFLDTYTTVLQATFVYHA